MWPRPFKLPTKHSSWKKPTEQKFTVYSSQLTVKTRMLAMYTSICVFSLWNSEVAVGFGGLHRVIQLQRAKFAVNCKLSTVHCPLKRMKAAGNPSAARHHACVLQGT